MFFKMSVLKNAANFIGKHHVKPIMLNLLTKSHFTFKLYRGL